LLTSFALLVIVAFLFFYSIPILTESRQQETIVGDGFFYSTLMCI